MRAVCITLLLVSLFCLEGQRFASGAPLLTKWFKTDNNTYYVEPEQKFTWQQAYAECKSRTLSLLSLKEYNADDLLQQYAKTNFDPVPDFWLKSNADIDLSNMVSSMTEQFFKLKFEDNENTEFLNADSPDNCVLTKDGSVKACEVMHGFICKELKSGNGAQNIQNIILKFS